MEIPVELLEKYEADYALQTAAIVEKLATFERDSALELDGPEHFQRRRKMLASVATENLADAFERYTGSNDLLPINYLSTGYYRSRAVGRLHFFDIELRKPVVATGFLISKDLVITNNHVLPDIAAFRDAQIEFDYEYDINGREKTKIIFGLNPEKFFHTFKALDIAIIGINEKDTSGLKDIRERGYLVLNGKLGKSGLGDYASVIQHAEGQPMQIALRENRILDNSLIDALIYNSDTAQGSSGSPVFNDEWQVIAIHSAGVAKKNADGKYIDKEGKPIPELNGKIDASKIVWISNRGIKISAVMKYLNQQFIQDPLIMQLFSPTYSDDKQLAFLSLPQVNGLNEAVQKNALTTLKEKANGIVYPDIHIKIQFGENTRLLNNGPSLSYTILNPSPEAEKKLEDEIDFSTSPGFDEFFLGVHTPIPTVSVKLKKQLAFLTENPNLFLLKYLHFSTIHHAVRKMPVMSAVNITSNKRFRLARTADDWYRDRRIDFDVQLTDDFYKKSGFDKGHMSRREDAEWGDDINFAEMAAKMTNVYTNACPQVPDINRAIFGYQGKWGGLEIALLEKAVLRETDGAKIVVYNGPVFSDEDPVFKGIQVPMKFWKIVVWRNAAKKLKTTGFILSQEKLVSEIPFEELQIDQIFKTAQCSIRQLEKLTRLSFTRIRNWDSFIPASPGAEEKQITGEEFEKFIMENKDDDSDIILQY